MHFFEKKKKKSPIPKQVLKMYSSRNELHFFFLKCVKSIYKAHMHTQRPSVTHSRMSTHSKRKRKKKRTCCPSVVP